jgi:hypothetical protein
MAKMLTNLTKFYSGDDLKFGNDFYDILDAKLKIFYDLYNKAGIGPGYYHSAYGIMLKGKAQDFITSTFSVNSSPTKRWL